MTEAEREGRWVLDSKVSAGYAPYIGPEGVGRMPSVVLRLGALEKGKTGKDAATAKQVDERFVFLLNAHSAVEIAEALLAQARRVLPEQG